MESYSPQEIKSDWNTQLHLSRVIPTGRILLKTLYFLSDERV